MLGKFIGEKRALNDTRSEQSFQPRESGQCNRRCSRHLRATDQLLNWARLGEICDAYHR